MLDGVEIGAVRRLFDKFYTFVPELFYRPVTLIHGSVILDEDITRRIKRE